MVIKNGCALSRSMNGSSTLILVYGSLERHDRGLAVSIGESLSDLVLWDGDHLPFPSAPTA